MFAFMLPSIACLVCICSPLNIALPLPTSVSLSLLSSISLFSLLSWLQDPTDTFLVRAQQLYDTLSQEVCPGHVILDDHTHLTIGARLRDVKLFGYPCTVIIGPKVCMHITLSWWIQGRSNLFHVWRAPLLLSFVIGLCSSQLPGFVFRHRCT